MKIDFPKELLENLYRENLSIKKVAAILQVNEKTIARIMKEKNIENVGSQGARRHRFNESFFEEIDTEEKAYWLGFIAADGCVYKGSDGSSNRLQINLKGDDSYMLERFQDAIGSNYKIAQKMSGKYKVAQLKVNSTKMCSDLMNHGIIYRKSIIVEFPKLKKEYERHYIRGYFDGDGSIGKYKKSYSVRIVGGSPMLLKIQDVFNSFGVEMNLRNVRDDIHELSIANSKALDGIEKFLYQDATIFLERKREIFIERSLNLSPSGAILSTKCGSIAGKA